VEKIPAGAPYALHYRIGTSGGINPEMTHPFSCGPNRALMHNGIFRFDMPKDWKGSDTDYLAHMLRRIPANPINNPALEWLLEEVCGTGNKLVFLDGLGNMNIINEEAGIWNKAERIWYSNSGAFPWQPFRYTTRYTEDDAALDAWEEQWSKTEDGWEKSTGKVTSVRLDGKRVVVEPTIRAGDTVYVMDNHMNRESTYWKHVIGWVGKCTARVDSTVNVALMNPDTGAEEMRYVWHAGRVAVLAAPTTPAPQNAALATALTNMREARAGVQKGVIVRPVSGP
jgi:hypothetical protein